MSSQLESLIDIAKLWREHCEEEVEYFAREGDQESAAEWRLRAKKADDAIFPKLKGSQENAI